MLITGIALMTLTTSLPVHAAAPAPLPQSSLALRVSIPLSSLKAAALARLPAVLGSIDQQQTLMGGVVTVQLRGEVRRSGDLTLVPEGDGLRLSLPVTATFRATPVGLGADSLQEALARDFSGAAVVTAHVTPVIGADWNAGLEVQADYRWTAPLSFELLRGVTINAQALIDPQIRSRLGSVSEALNASLRTGLKLRERATDLWGRLSQPWTLPGIEGSYVQIRPQGLSVTPISFGTDAASLTLGGSFVALAGLAQTGLGQTGSGQMGSGQTESRQMPVPVPSTPLPPLRVEPPPSRGVQLEVPVTLAYQQLSDLATRYARAQAQQALPLPLSPRLSVQQVVLSTPAPGQLNAAVSLTVRALGLSVAATVDVSGTPQLESQVLSLQGVSVKTRAGSLSGRVLGWLADGRVQALLQQRARFDLEPELKRAQAALQTRLPSRVSSGVVLSGQVGRLALKSVRVLPQGVVALTQAQGDLEARVELGK